MSELRKVWIKGSPGAIDELVVHGYDVIGGATDVSIRLGVHEMPTVEVSYQQEDVTLDIEAVVEAYGLHHPDTKELLRALERKARLMRRECKHGDDCEHAQGVEIAADIVRLMSRGEEA